MHEYLPFLFWYALFFALAPAQHGAPLFAKYPGRCACLVAGHYQQVEGCLALAEPC